MDNYRVVKVVFVRIHEDHRRVRRGEGDDDLYAGRAHRGADQQAFGHQAAQRVAN